MLELSGQEFIRGLQDQFVDPVKACLAARLGVVPRNSGRLLLTEKSANFISPQGEESIEVNAPQQDISRLKTFVHRYFENADSTIQIEIDHQLLLVRQVRLPLAAKRNLENVVGYEMDRLSPFEADEVYYHFTPLKQNEKGGWLEGRLIVAQKSRLDPWYQLLSELGVAVEKVTLTGESQPLALKSRQTGMAQPRSRSSAFLWAAVAALFMVAIGSVIWQQRQISIDLQQKMQAAREHATESMQIEEKLSERRLAVGMVTAQKQDYLAMSDLLLELTRLIPPGSWLQRVSVSSTDLVVTGLSEQASELIALLEASSLFESVRFKSPVVRDRRSGKEKFDLAMKLSQEQQK
ncbi:MAG: PilN domain-containing protein [Candidatus Thiodiazotropha sp. DIVDIV]